MCFFLPIKYMPIATNTDLAACIHFVLMVRPRIEPGSVSHQGSPASTFTFENSLGSGFATDKEAALSTEFIVASFQWMQWAGRGAEFLAVRF